MRQDREYQTKLKADVYDAWNGGARNVLASAPTGGGKTVIMSDIAQEHRGASIVIAHRQELVSQVSLALARNGLRHRHVGPENAAREIVRIHMDELGRSYLDPNAWHGVAGVDTLIRRPAESWFQQVTLWQTDEAHHVLKDNKWGRACAMFPNARGIGWTATPGRADGRGLGRHADGVMDALVHGPSMRSLIDQGWLTEYKIFCPRTEDLDLDGVNITAGGDFSPDKLKKAVRKSRIVGDIVKHYLRIAPGKLGVTFAVDVDDAVKIAAAYNSAGVPAEVVTAETPDTLRTSILRRFRTRQILQLVNVDLFGEGFDLPAIEVVSMGRPTASYGLYAQQFGRALRLLAGKLFGIIIDHVGNVLRHNGPPDRERQWTLDRRVGKATASSDLIPFRVCPDCTAPYERTKAICPYCLYRPEPMGRSLPEQVDGDLIELGEDMLRKLRGEIARIDGPSQTPAHLQGTPAATAIHRRHMDRQTAQIALRGTIALWAGWRRLAGETDSEIYRRFWHNFGTDVMTAQALGATEAETLRTRLTDQLRHANVAIDGEGN